MMNGQVETFVTQVQLQLNSTDDNKTTEIINAFITDELWGNISLIDWNKDANTWKHLKGIKLFEGHKREWLGNSG